MSAVLGGTAVVVVNYRSAHLLERGLAPLAAWSERPAVVVVDNWSGAEESQRVADLAERHGWTAILAEDNPGFGAGVNRGAAAAAAAGATTLAIINPDAAIEEADLVRLVQRCQAQPWGLYAPRIVKADGSTWFDGAVLDLESGRTMSLRRAEALGVTGAMPWLSGAVLVTSMDLWNALEGFDEDYFLYWEDVDLSARALRLGAELAVVADAVAMHDEGGTQGAGRNGRSRPWTRSERYYYFNIRNRLLFAARNLSPERARAWSGTAWRSAYQTLLIGGRRKFLRPVMPVRAGYRGVRDGRALVASGARRDSGERVA